MSKPEPQYLGDGVYAQLDDQQRIVLTTGDHRPGLADNTIFMEPEIVIAFNNYQKRVVEYLNQ